MCERYCSSSICILDTFQITYILPIPFTRTRQQQHIPCERVIRLVPIPTGRDRPSGQVSARIEAEEFSSRRISQPRNFCIGRGTSALPAWPLTLNNGTVSTTREREEFSLPQKKSRPKFTYQGCKLKGKIGELWLSVHAPSSIKPAQWQQSRQLR